MAKAFGAFFRSVYRTRADRRAPRAPRASDLLRYLGNRALEPVDRLLRARYRRRDLPIAFIVCVPRSGGTVLYQVMTRFLDLGYVNNRMARYWAAPLVGALRHGRLPRDGIGFDSTYGRSAGPSGPHEFAWFWHYHGAFAEADALDTAALGALDGGGIASALEGLAGYFGRPLVIKSIDYVNYQIAWLKRLLPQARFVCIERDRAKVAASILRARRSENAHEQLWWSTRPADFRAFAARPAAEQIEHQIADIEAAIGRGFAAIPPADSLRVQHADLVADPRAVLARLARFLGTRVLDPEGLAALRLTRGA